MGQGGLLAYSTTGSSRELQTVGAVASKDEVPAVNEGKWWVGVGAVTACQLKPSPRNSRRLVEPVLSKGFWQSSHRYGDSTLSLLAGMQDAVMPAASTSSV